MSDDAIDFFQELVERNGVAVSTVKDGTVLMFKRKMLQALLDQHPNDEKLIIFVKKPEFKD